MDIQSGLIAPMDELEKFYNQANTSMQKLIENRFEFLFNFHLWKRRLWDKYIVPENSGGSRIPQHFLEPPYPSSDAWKQYIVLDNDDI